MRALADDSDVFLLLPLSENVGKSRSHCTTFHDVDVPTTSPNGFPGRQILDSDQSGTRICRHTSSVGASTFCARPVLCCAVLRKRSRPKYLSKLGS